MIARGPAARVGVPLVLLAAAAILAPVHAQAPATTAATATPAPSPPPPPVSGLRHTLSRGARRASAVPAAVARFGHPQQALGRRPALGGVDPRGAPREERRGRRLAPGPVVARARGVPARRHGEGGALREAGA